MSMPYEDALREWGARKLEEAGHTNVDRSIVNVEMDFNQGYHCGCGGDPNCYCSFEEAPSANISISSGRASITIDHYSFDFASVLGEIVAVGGGLK